jgi:hypothetical protein
MIFLFFGEWQRIAGQRDSILGTQREQEICFPESLHGTHDLVPLTLFRSRVSKDRAVYYNNDRRSSTTRSRGKSRAEIDRWPGDGSEYL